MSEYKCPELGCNYQVGISTGPNLTEQDWEVEQYYFDEIAEHEQEHWDRRQKENRAYELREELARTEGEQVTVCRAELEKLLDWADSATRTIGEFVAWVDSCPGNEKPSAVAAAEGGETKTNQ